MNSGLSLSPIERIAVGRKIVGHFHHSALATEALRRRQEQMQLPIKKLKQDVATRWNSTLLMLESLINNRWPISAVLSDTNVTNARYRHLDMKPEQWELVENLIKVLQPLQIATTFLSYEACSCVLPVLTQSLEVSEVDCSNFKRTVVAA